MTKLKLLLLLLMATHLVVVRDYPCRAIRRQPTPQQLLWDVLSCSCLGRLLHHRPSPSSSPQRELEEDAISAPSHEINPQQVDLVTDDTLLQDRSPKIRNRPPFEGRGGIHHVMVADITNDERGQLAKLVDDDDSEDQQDL